MTTFSTKFLTFLMVSFIFSSVHGLSKDYYSKTCPNLETIVRTEMNKAIIAEKRMGASILRLFFHDCFVEGCNGGPLLDKDENGNTEQTAFPNINSLRGFEVIDAIKTAVESDASCKKQTVSCADILALAARDGVYLLGGPTWDVKLGRSDTRTTNEILANSALPGPGSSLTNLRTSFGAQGFSLTDIVALSGAHTIGKSHCGLLTDRINNDQNIDATFKSQLKQNCSQSSFLPSIDDQTPESFDNKYYVDLTQQKGLFHSDQELYSSSTFDIVRFITKFIVDQYVNYPESFKADFVSAMIKLSELPSPAGGEIRLNCHNVN